MDIIKIITKQRALLPQAPSTNMYSFRADFDFQQNTDKKLHMLTKIQMDAKVYYFLRICQMFLKYTYNALMYSAAGANTNPNEHTNISFLCIFHIFSNTYIKDHIYSVAGSKHQCCGSPFLPSPSVSTLIAGTALFRPTHPRGTRSTVVVILIYS